MKKKLVLFSDGTGNSSIKAQKTNVWRLFQALEQRSGHQLAMYDDGVGTSSTKYLAAIGLAFGWGLKRNVLGLYKFVCRNFEQRADKQGADEQGADERRADIYGFGFSRGAFTIRVLVGLIAREGLVTFRSEAELDRNAAAAYRHYRSASFPSWSPIVIVLRWVRDGLIWARNWIRGHQTYAQVAADTEGAKRTKIRIKFLGLWDTVEAYGMPIAELKRGIDWVLWPMLFGDFKLSPLVDRACHALSLDDQRKTFHPLLWNEAAESDMVAEGRVLPGRITQIWFAGVHSNLGGGYPEDQLSLVSLDWMIGEATHSGLAIDKKTIDEVAVSKSPYARLYDSRGGVAAYYRYAPRQIPILTAHDGQPIRPIVHSSVVMRMVHGSDDYAPISLPRRFWVLAPDGELLPMEGFEGPLRLDATKRLVASASLEKLKHVTEIAAEKASLQAAITQLGHPESDAVGLVWDTVWWRRAVYFLTVGLTIGLVLFPAFPGHGWRAAIDESNRALRGPVESLVDALSGFIPSYATPWIQALKAHPVEFAALVAAILISLRGSTILQARIHDRARLAWHDSPRQGYDAWFVEHERGLRNATALVVVIAAALLVTAIARHWHANTTLEIATITAAGALLLIVRGVVGAKLSAAVSSPQGKTLPSTFTLRLARTLRTTPWLVSAYRGVFVIAVPILFAIGLLVVGLAGANRAAFDALSATGHFCNGLVKGEARLHEKTGSSAGFTTNSMCWPSGLVLEGGRRYRIKLVTPGDWIDRTIRTDVEGFRAFSFPLYLATPLKRWWGQNWFKPIARIDEIGNDEYALDSTAPLEPDARQVLTAEITARTTGELFLYVNDAIVAWPGKTDLFVANNHGTGTVTVERIAPLPKPD